ncbi:hypothetical protein [Solemya velum gill symbiont]|nr:hypothetical protein [Solemya velum gill symbiont]
MKQLLAIIEMGGYPNFIPLYRSLGFEVHVENSVRKARSWLKKTTPDVIVAEYNFQSQFRDRTSNLETLMAVLEKYGSSKVIAFYDTQTQHKLALLQERFPLHDAIPFPVSEEKLTDALERI